MSAQQSLSTLSPPLGQGLRQKSTQKYYYFARIKGPFWMIFWFLMRFIHIRVLLNWAWDPDKYDLRGNVVNIGVFRKTRFGFPIMVGGARLIFPQDSLEETVTFGEKSFATMVMNHSGNRDALNSDLGLVTEATRLLIFFFELKNKSCLSEIVDVLMQGIYAEAALHKRPFVLFVVNSWLQKTFKRYGFTVKMLGMRWFNSKNAGERQHYGDRVPHYVMILNLLASENTVKLGTFNRFSANLKRQGGLPFNQMGNALEKRINQLWTSLLEVPEKVLSDFQQQAALQRQRTTIINKIQKRESATVEEAT